MKRFLAIAVLMLLYPLQGAFAQSSFWTIEDFHADIAIRQDGSLLVRESILADFNMDRHGIYRDIPVKYTDDHGQRTSIKLNVLSVHDADGNAYEVKQERNGDYLRLRIGDPDRTVIGEQLYVIEYEADRALRFFQDHDELYWNVTGDAWDTTIKQASARVTIFADPGEPMQTRCFTGAYGSHDEACEITVSSNTQVEYDANDFLTIIAGWPKGLIPEPTAADKWFAFLLDNYGYVLLPLMAFALMFGLWKRYGDDPDDPPGLVVQYDPPADLTPAEVSYLMHQSVKPEALPAEIVHLAAKGYLQIEELKSDAWLKKEDYLLKRLKQDKESRLPAHQRALLDYVFGESGERKISDLKPSEAKLKTIRDRLHEREKEKGYFVGRPSRIKGIYFSIGNFLIWGGAIFFEVFPMHLAIGIILSGVVVTIFSFFMSKMTQEGVLAKEHALGFKRYIDQAETRRVRWQETQKIFFDVLPYAMVFGIAKKWAKAFEGSFTNPPEWYTSHSGSFNSITFADSLSSFSSATISSVTPKSSSSSSGFSSGGGFSGGGSGGGGGGSW